MDRAQLMDILNVALGVCLALYLDNRGYLA